LTGYRNNWHILALTGLIHGRSYAVFKDFEQFRIESDLWCEQDIARFTVLAGFHQGIFKHIPYRIVEFEEVGEYYDLIRPVDASVYGGRQSLGQPLNGYRLNLIERVGQTTRSLCQAGIGVVTYYDDCWFHNDDFQS